MSINQIINAARTIASLPDIASPAAAPNLAEHITTAKAFSNQWIQHQALDISTGVQSVSGMINNWNNVHKHQIELLENKPENREQIKAILQTVAGQSENAKALFEGLKNGIADDTKKVAAYSGDLTGDATRIQAKITGDEATIKALQVQIAKAQAKINDYHSRDWMWAIPVYGWIERGIESLVSNISGCRASINSLRAEEGPLRGDANTLKAVTASVSVWIEAMKLLAQSMSSIGTTTDNIYADLKNAIANIDDIDVDTYPIWLKAQIINFDDQLNTLGSIVIALNS